jgi:hypothetical protein
VDVIYIFMQLHLYSLWYPLIMIDRSRTTRRVPRIDRLPLISAGLVVFNTAAWAAFITKPRAPVYFVCVCIEFIYRVHGW